MFGKGRPDGLRADSPLFQVVVRLNYLKAAVSLWLRYSTIADCRRSLLTLMFLFAAVPGWAQTLTFEGLQNEEEILNYYNGGLGGSGSGPGPNYGITFSSDALALIASSAGGSGNFSGEPSPVTTMFFLSGTGPTMDDPGGFTSLYFYYSNTTYTGDVTIWSGLDGTGTELANISLPALGLCEPAPNFCNWQYAGATLGGVAESAIFGGTANEIIFDNVTLTAVPEPSVYAMVLLGLALIGFVARRRPQQGESGFA